MLGSARIRPLPARCLAVLVWLCACGKDARAQQPPVDVKVVFVQAAAAKKQASTGSADVSNVAVWLTSLDPSAERAASTTAAKFVPKLVQRNKVFEPHMLVIHVGTVVQFPNKDPFFHNVFSLFDGKRKNIVEKRIRSEEHTSELQSQSNLVCRLLLEKKKKTKI